jgi:hypothetical protein
LEGLEELEGLEIVGRVGRVGEADIYLFIINNSNVFIHLKLLAILYQNRLFL